MAESALSLIAGLKHSHASILLSLMHHAQLTSVFEVLQPEYQHVVDLSYLSSSELNFITWTTGYGVREDKKNKAKSHCALAPDAALDFARLIGKTSPSRSLNYSDFRTLWLVT